MKQHYYAIVFFSIVMLSLLADLPEQVSAPCLIDSNCPYYEFCNFFICSSLSCADQRFLICTSDAACGAGKSCTPVVDIQPINHACGSCVGCLECLSCPSPLADCNNNGGCETNTGVDVRNCGSCGNDCTISGKNCVSGSCQCSAGYLGAECSAGQTKTLSCGSFPTVTQTCGSDCQWVGLCGYC